MLAPLLGLAGVIGGLALGSGFRFWIDRRAEITDALEAASLLGSMLRGALADPHGTSTAALAHAWEQHRTTLIRHMPPRMFQAYEARWQAQSDHAATDDRLLAATDALVDLFWQEHEAFIFVPLINVVRGNPVSKRLEAAVSETLRLPAAS